MRTLTLSCLAPLILAGCAFGTIPTNKGDCEAQGGRWVVNVRRDTASCHFPVRWLSTPTIARWTPTPGTAPRPTATRHYESNPSTPTPMPAPPSAAPTRDPWEPIPFVLAAPFPGRRALLFVTDDTEVLRYGDRPGEPLKIWASRQLLRCERHPHAEPHGMIDMKNDRLFLVLPDCSILEPPPRWP